MNSHYSLSERLHFAHNPTDNPYPAYYAQVHDGSTSLSRITCGHNPYLYARIVDEFEIIQDEHGTEKAMWREIPSPEAEGSK